MKKMAFRAPGLLLTFWLALAGSLFGQMVAGRFNQVTTLLPGDVSTLHLRAIGDSSALLLVSQSGGNFQQRNLYGRLALSGPPENRTTPALQQDLRPLTSLKDRIVDVVFAGDGLWLLTYSDWALKPGLYRYSPPEPPRAMTLGLPDSNLLVLKALIGLAPGHLVAAGYREAPDGAVVGREAVLVFLEPAASRAELLPLGVADQEDGFEELLRVNDSLLVVAGYRREGASRTVGRLIGLNPQTRNIVFETAVEGFFPRDLVRLPDGNILLAGGQDGWQDLDAALIQIDRSGKILQRWQSRVTGRDEALALGVSLDGRVLVGGYRREVPWYGKFQVKPLRLLLSKQGDPTGVEGRILALSETPAGLLFLAGSGRNRAGQSAALVIVEKSSSPAAFPPRIELEARFQDSSGDGMLAPEEAFSLEIGIRNQGKTALVSGQLVLEKPPSDLQFDGPLVQPLPMLFPGDRQTWRLTGRAAGQLNPQGSALLVRIRQRNARTLAEKTVPILRAFQNQMDFRVEAYPTTIQPGDTNQIHLVIRNASPVDFSKLHYKVTAGLDAAVLSGDLEGELLFFSSGKQARRKIKVFVPQGGATGALPLVVSLYSAEAGFHVERTVQLQLPESKAWTEEEWEKLTKNLPTLAQGYKFKPDLDIDVEAHIPQGPAPDPNRFAVVVGIRDYRKPIPPVDFALRDAALVREYLIRVMGFPEGNVFYLPNATKSELELYFGDEADYRGKLYNMIPPGQAEVLVFYTGHGAPGKEKGEGNYLVPSDADARYLKLSGYPLNTFYRNLSQLPARRVAVIVDACFSGQVYANLSPVFAYVPPEERLLNRLRVLTSTSDVQPSCWLPEKKHSLFTYLFLKGIQTFQADLDGDGAILLSEVYRYVTDSRSLDHSVPYLARKLQNVDQHPRLLGKGQDFVLVKQGSKAW